jgi:succinyl-CoA synthetase alpha subunit
MSILINKDTKVVTQGITGKTGQFHTRMCREYANGKNCFVAGVNPKKAGEDFEGIPIFANVREAKAKTGANVSVIYVPPAGAAAAIWEAVEAELDLAICITEGIPVRDMMALKDRMAKSGSKTLLLGPNCPGLISPGKAKVGILPAQIVTPGPVGVISRSGTLTYEAVYHLTRAGLGQTTCVGIGGDPLIGTSFVDCLEAFGADDETRAIVMIGEIGGTDEQMAAEHVRDHLDIPVVGFIAGQTAPPGRRMGHAGAIISGSAGTAEEKIKVFEQCGIPVARRPVEIANLIREALA